MKKKNIFTLVIAAVLVVSLAVVFTACNNEPEKPEVPETTEVSTTEKEIPVIEEDTTEEETVKETEKETVKETEKETVKETEKETEKVTEKETEKVTQKPVSNSGSGNKTETPKKDTPKKDNTETTKKPSSSNSNKNDSNKNNSGATGGLDLSTFDVTRTAHVGGESSEEAESAAQAAIDKNGWNMDWELS